jgi:hypothetical protein
MISIKAVLASPLSLINVPLNSWVYPTISRLETLQAFEGNDIIALNTKPLTRLEVALLIDTALSNLQRGKLELNQQNLLLMEKLVNEFQDELSAPGLKIIKLNKTTVILDTLRATFQINPYFNQKVDNKAQNKENKDFTNTLYSFSELGAIISGSFSENSAFYLNASVYTDLDLVSNIFEREIPLKAQINQAYLKLQLPSFKIPIPSNTPFFPSLSDLEFPALDLLVGRNYMKWGPGYQGNLILSDNSPAFDMIKYSGTIDLNELGEGLGRVNFTKFFSLLEPLDGKNRYFLGQRLEYKPLDTLTLGLSETAIISENSSILFFNPIPFIPPYYLTRWIADKLKQNSEINSNVGIDIELNLSPGIKLYGEWMADDFILTPKTNPYPNRTGFLAGAYFADPLANGNTDFRIEYTHINNYVYFPTHPWQDYLYQGEYIGHPLGPDADQLYLELTHRLSDKLNLSLSYNHQRHGEGQTGIPLPSDPVIANENIFLSGIIEKQQAYQTELSYIISPQWELSASATLENIKNKDNNLGMNENNTYFQMELNYQF